MKLIIGNIFKLYNSLHIVTDVDDKNTYWISFDYSNCSGITRNKSYIRKEMCWDCDINDGGDIDYECENCKGTGEYDKQIDGMDKAEFLAETCKDYIIERLTKNFDF